MALDKTKIVATPVRVYVRTYNSTPAYVLSGYTEVGWTKEGGTKFTVDVSSETLQDGALAQTGVTSKVEVEAVESDASKISVLEALALASNVDIMLVKGTGIAGQAALFLPNYGLTVGGSFGFSIKGANVVKLTAQRNGSKATDTFSEVTAS